MNGLPKLQGEWLPNEIRIQWAIALRSLRKDYGDQDISRFLDAYLTGLRQYRPRLGLPRHQERRAASPRETSPPAAWSVIPPTAFALVANLGNAYNDARRVISEGVGGYLGSGAVQLLDRELASKRSRGPRENAKRKKRAEAIWNATLTVAKKVGNDERARSAKGAWRLLCDNIRKRRSGAKTPDFKLAVSVDRKTKKEKIVQTSKKGRAYPVSFATWSTHYWPHAKREVTSSRQ